MLNELSHRLKILTWLDRGEMDLYLKNEYTKHLVKELNDLVEIGEISPIHRDLTLRLKAKEYFRYKKKDSGTIKFLLGNFPEIFKIHDLMSMDKPAQKFFFVVNMKVEKEFEKILSYQNINCEKHHATLTDGRKINLYIGILEDSKQYSLETNPVRKVFNIAEDAGIRIGFYYYSEDFSLCLIREFPIQSDEYGDYSYASGGFREDLNAGFKSAWEANIARILNEKNLEWEYEAASKSFATDIGYYIPDFRVKKGDKTYIIEVKGYWNNKSLKKVWSAMKQTKDEKFIIIDPDYYYLLNEKYRKTIPYWENTVIPKRTYELPVIGLTVGNRTDTIKSLQYDEQLKVMREPDNPYDSNAIKVVTKDNKEIGYIAKEWASVFAFKLDSGFTYDVYLKQKELNKKRIIVNVTARPASTNLLNNIGILS